MVDIPDIPATLFLVHSTQILDIPASPGPWAHLICLPSSKLVRGDVLCLPLHDMNNVCCVEERRKKIFLTKIPL